MIAPPEAASAAARSPVAVAYGQQCRRVRHLARVRTADVAAQGHLQGAEASQRGGVPREQCPTRWVWALPTELPAHQVTVRYRYQSRPLPPCLGKIRQAFKLRHGT